MAGGDIYLFAEKPAAFRFAAAISAVAAVFLLESFLGSYIDEGSRLLLLGTAVMASAWVAGTAPALAATVAGALLGTWHAPAAELESAFRATHTHLALFVAHSLLLIGVVSELRRAHRAAESRAMEAQAARRGSEEAARLKDEFLATISHELRTPLNAVLGWIYLLRSGRLEPDVAVRGLESIERNVKLQAQLTGDLLDISKSLTGRLQLESRPVSLSEAVRQAVASASLASQARGVRLSASIPDRSVPVLGDITRLRQIAWHLLINAIKFTPRGGSVSISVSIEGEVAALTVADSGPGVDPEFLPRAFDRFTQADSSPTRTAGGLGLGLAFVRDLVELHGGDIRAENREGGGAVFTARFPLHAAAAGEATASVARPASGRSTLLDGLRVLVLDRDADGRDLLRIVLEQRGAVVRTAASVGDALEALESWRPDVLVSDSAAPDRDSYAVVGRVRSLEPDRGGRIPAVALMPSSSLDRHVNTFLEPVKRELPKPVDPGALAAEIAKLTGLERRRTQRAS